MINAVVSFRSIPRIFRIFRDNGCRQIDWIPHFTSVINWTLRLGLSHLNSIGKIAEPWLAIVDITIDVGLKKALVVLRANLNTLKEKGKALALADCECIGIAVSDNWNGKTISAALASIFENAGLPVAIVKDQGTDLGLGVRLWKSSAKANGVFVISDIGHAMANALKAAFGKRKAFEYFLDSIKAIGAKLRQSDLAFLAPPKVRTKGRFQSIMNIADWGERIVGLTGGQGRAKDGSLADRLRKFMPNFGIHRLFIESFAKTCLISAKVLSLLKNNGLNRDSYHSAVDLLNELPERSKVRKRMILWLRKHMSLHCRLGIGQLPLVVSSDVIETLFGKFKIVIQRNPKADFNRLILVLPTLCGVHTYKSVQDALIKVSHSDLLKWQKENIFSSQIKKRRKFLAGKRPGFE